MGDEEGGSFYEEGAEEYEPAEGLHEQDEFDEDGQPLMNPDEIKDIINAIPSFRFEEASRPPTAKGQGTNALSTEGSQK